MEIMYITLWALAYLLVGYHIADALGKGDEAMTGVVTLTWPAVILQILLYIFIDKITWRR